MRKVAFTSHIILCLLFGIVAHGQQEPGIEMVYKRTATALISQAIERRGFSVVSSYLIVDSELHKNLSGFRMLNATLSRGSQVSQIRCKVQFDHINFNAPKESDKSKLFAFINFCHIQDSGVASDLRAWDSKNAPNVFEHFWNFIDLTAEEVAALSQAK
jgi:hypothetical protein